MPKIAQNGHFWRFSPFLAFLAKIGLFSRFSGPRERGFYINPSRRGPAVPGGGPEGPPEALGPGPRPGGTGRPPPPRTGAEGRTGVDAREAAAGCAKFVHVRGYSLGLDFWHLDMENPRESVLHRK